MVTENPDVLALLRARLPSMTKVLTRIGKFVQENPEQVQVLSINEVADASQASIASVMRFCNELDYTSFASFKLALATELALRARDEKENGPLGKTASHADQLSEKLCEVIQMSAGLLNEANIDEIALQLIDAHRVLLFGNGASFLPATFMSYKLTRLGINNFLASDSHMTRMAANTSDENDLMILFSSSGSVRESIDLAKLARNRSLPTIAFTNRFKSPLGEVCDRQIMATGSESPLSSGSLESKCGHLFFVELLYDAICRLSDVHAERIRDAADAVTDQQY